MRIKNGFQVINFDIWSLLMVFIEIGKVGGGEEACVRGILMLRFKCVKFKNPKTLLQYCRCQKVTDWM